MVFNMFHEEFCNTDLCLNFGYQEKHKSEREIEEEPNKKPCLLSSSSITSTSSDPCLPLHFPDECDQTRKNFRINRECQNSATQFSFTTTGNGQRGPSRLIKKEEQEGGGRKKLRLTKDQAVFLEATFKEHKTVNPKQKKDLARQLNLRLKQVEVWFQNRRARTKLQQIEEGYENLKKICETLKVENKKLQKEIHELKAIKIAQPLNMLLPAATLTLCPSCQRTDPGGLIKHPSATPERHL